MSYTVWFKGDDFTATFDDYAESTHYAAQVERMCNTKGYTYFNQDQ